MEGANYSPREASFTKLQAGFVANYDFLGFWMVKGAPVVHPENQVAGTGEEISYSDHAHQTPGHLSCSDLGRAQKVGPTKSAPLRTT